VKIDELAIYKSHTKSETKKVTVVYNHLKEDLSQLFVKLLDFKQADNSFLEKNVDNLFIEIHIYSVLDYIKFVIRVDERRTGLREVYRGDSALEAYFTSKAIIQQAKKAR
jgi:hypothetical protein